MQWIEVKVIFDDALHLPFTELVADAFYRFGIPGVVIEDPNEPVPENEDTPELKIPQRHSVSGYFADGLESMTHFEAVVRQLARQEGVDIHLHSRAVDEEDWAESWKAFFHPERVGDRLVVKPSWREVKARPGDLILEIDPGMAFGTGTHPTTSMCLELLEQTVVPGGRVLDVGCGSGILMIAAAKLGADWIAGIDQDPIAVDIAGKNLIRNGIPKEGFGVYSGNLVDCITDSYDIVVSNILAEVIVGLLEDLKPVLKPGGLFIGSGIIRERYDMVEAAMADNGLGVLKVLTKDQWVTVVARRVADGRSEFKPSQ